MKALRAVILSYMQYILEVLFPNIPSPLNWTDPSGYNKYTFPFILPTSFLFPFCDGHTSCFCQIKNIPFLLPFLPLPSFPPFHASHAASQYRSVLADSAPQSQMWMRGKRPATVRRTAQPPPLRCSSGCPLREGGAEASQTEPRMRAVQHGENEQNGPAASGSSSIQRGPTQFVGKALSYRSISTQICMCCFLLLSPLCAGHGAAQGVGCACTVFAFTTIHYSEIIQTQLAGAECVEDPLLFG